MNERFALPLFLFAHISIGTLRCFLEIIITAIGGKMYKNLAGLYAKAGRCLSGRGARSQLSTSAGLRNNWCALRFATNYLNQ